TRDQGPHNLPVEPSLSVKGDHLVAVAGKPGKGVDAGQVASAVVRAARHGLPIKVRVPRGTASPRFPLAEAQRLVGPGEALTSSPLSVTAGPASTNLAPGVLRRWLRAFPGGASLVLGLDATAINADLTTLLPDATTNPLDAEF